MHPSRPRRACFGDLIQIDGSPHDWFEGRAPRCTLIVFIDDATSRLIACRFAAAETTEAYMETTRAHLVAYGRPVAYYSDRYGVFRVNKKGKEDELTQFSRSLKTLDIEAIHAHSPQAKGRVERANQTLQDRLVKEMRLRGISDMAAVVQVGREWGCRWMRKIGADAALALGYGRSAPFAQCQGSTPRSVQTSDVHEQRTDRKGDILTLV